jgi:hypothetical protein
MKAVEDEAIPEAPLAKFKRLYALYGPCALYEKMFWGLGYAVGLYPLTTIVIFVTLAAAASSGLVVSLCPDSVRPPRGAR